MSIYEDFSQIYSRGNYPRYSEKMAELLPDILGRLDIHPREILDLACGEGTFAVKVSQYGFEVTGIDQSDQMIQIARRLASTAGVDVTFLQADMRSLPFGNDFDLVTCWFDSLNYLLTSDDLVQAFRQVRQALKPQGYFIFDMNTLFQLSTKWQEVPCYVQQDKSKIFELHRTDFDEESKVASLTITAFIRDSNEDGKWSRIDETHKEKGYELSTIKKCLINAGFKIVKCWDNIISQTPPEDDSGKIWFVTQNPAQAQ